MKTCTKCGIEKDEVEFGKEKRVKSGIKSRCKKCDYIKNREYSKTDKARERARIYETSITRKSEKRIQYNKDYCLLYSKLEKQIEYRKKYYKENKEKLSNIRKEYQKTENGKSVYAKSGCKYHLKKQIGEIPPPELVEIKVLINKTKRLCKTLKS